MPSTIAMLLLISLLSLTLQDGPKPPVTLPVLPNQDVKLVPPSIPTELTGPAELPGAQTPTSTSVIGEQMQVQFREGVLRIKIGGTWFPASGSCCFCPDGAEKPVRWEPAKQPAAQREKR